MATGKSFLGWIFFFLGGIMFFVMFLPYVFAATSAATTTTQVINAGSLSVTIQNTTTTLPSTTVSPSQTTTTGTLASVNVDDKRGTAVGWTLSMNLQHLTVIQNPFAASGNTSPLISIYSGARYNGTCGISYPASAYTVKIVSGGSVGAATYDATGGCTGETTQSSVVTQATNATVGSRGVAINFTSGTYVAADKWTIPVDTHPYTNMFVTPLTPIASEAGSSLSGVIAASAATLAGTGVTSDGKILLTASSGEGMGSYLQDATLRLTVHGHNYSGTYQATLTVTIV